MLKRIVLVAAAALPMTLVAVGPASASNATTLTFPGQIACYQSGSITINPPATNTGTSPATVTSKAVLSGCVGSTTDGTAKITGGVITTKSTLPSNSCSALASGLPKLVATVKWKATGVPATYTGVTPSHVAWSGGAVTATSPITISYPNGGGTGTTTGSFAGKHASQVIIIDEALATVSAECGGSGVGTLHYTGVNGKSTLHLSA